ncbi:hypothetical protein SLE2022_094580 [Rubroshorea leprosula]
MKGNNMSSVLALPALIADGIVLGQKKKSDSNLKKKTDSNVQESNVVYDLIKTQPKATTTQFALLITMSPCGIAVADLQSWAEQKILTFA